MWPLLPRGGRNRNENPPGCGYVYHQTGTRHMAARPIFGLSEQDRQDIRQSLADWLEKTWSKT